MAESERLKQEEEASDISLEEMGYKQELKRALTIPDMIVYGLIFMVPIAPFGIYGGVFNDSNGMPSLVYLIGMIAMIFTAFSYAALSREFPVSGSVYGYVSRGINKHLGFFAGWAILMDYLLVPTLLYVVAAQAMSGLVPGVPAIVWALLFIVINTSISFVGIELTANINKIALAAELIVLAIFVGMGAYTISTSDTLAFTSRPFYNPDGFSLNVVMGAVSLGVLSFLGFDGISTLSEEAKDAKRGPGIATIASLLIVGCLFMLQTYIAGCLSPDGAVFADDPDNAFYLVAEVAGGKFLYALCAVATAIAWGIFNALAAQTALSRILFAMGRDEMLPKALSKVHPKYKTPYIAILFVAIATVVLVAIFNSLGIDAISRLVNFGALTSFMLLNITVVYHFFIKKKDHKVFMHLIMPLVGLLIIIYVWISLDSQAKILGLCWLAIGIVYYLILTLVLKRKNTGLEV
jgi:amino acid transporter